MLIHFRITTHGGTCPECTHPFPISSDVGALQKTRYESPYAVIHNGIIDLTSLTSKSRTKQSDTMVFVEKYLTKLASYKGWFANPTTPGLIYDMIDSKMAILNAKGEIISTQGFEKDKDGNWYSNTSYKESRHKSYSYYSSDYCDIYSDNEWDYGYSRLEKLDLMRLRPKDLVYMDDGSIYTYDDISSVTDGEWAVYLDQYGNIFIYERDIKTHTPKEENLKYISDKYLILYGTGVFMDEHFKEREFEPDEWTYM